MPLDLRKIGLKALLSLPTPILRAISGGRPVWRGGRTLEPRLQYLAAAARARHTSGMPPEEMRLYGRELQGIVAAPVPPSISLEALEIEGPGGLLPLRLYRPPSPDPAAPLLVFAHMGGVAGALETSDALCGRLALTTRGPVLSVDYRLAPEHRFPAGFEDFLTAVRWARDNLHRYAASDVAVGGDSLGGGFAAAACQALKAAGEPQPARQLLIYPLLDMGGEGAAMATYADAWPLSKADIAAFVAQHLGPEADPADPRCSPLRGKDLSGLAPALIVQAGFDPTGDQPLAYARRLIEAGAPVTFRCYDNLAHGFAMFAGVVPAAEAAVREIAELAAEPTRR